MAGLTTHILDTAHGCPAASVAIRLFVHEPAGGLHLLVATNSNKDGRTDRPLIDAEAMAPGRYRLEFGIGDYFRAKGVVLADPPFLDVVTIDFGIAERTAHYHVPLLASPFGYSTYRGS